MANFQVVYFKNFEDLNVKHFIAVSFIDASNYF